LHGHTSEGYGLSWNSNVTGQILSGSDDSLICLWDIREACLDVQTLQIFKGHKSGVEDVAWCHFSPTKFASVGDDSQLMVWDSRDNRSGRPVDFVENAHNGDVHCLAFNPFDEFSIATGGSDGIVSLWDTRLLKKKVKSLFGHYEGVYQVSWAPTEKNVLASSGIDRRVYVWDTATSLSDHAVDATVETSPELLFLHGGHTSKVSDFSWSPDNRLLVASVAEDNILQVWKMVSCLHFSFFLLLWLYFEGKRSSPCVGLTLYLRKCYS
jgi:WD40 repeat protein